MEYVNMNENLVIGEYIDLLLMNRISTYLATDFDSFTEKAQFVRAMEYNNTDNIGEVIEKLIILHIRTWMLEDKIKEATTPEDIADIKQKIDQCFKVKRPKLVQAINQILDDAIVNGKALKENSVKLYKGV
jgi:hypothetical protein